MICSFINSPPISFGTMRSHKLLSNLLVRSLCGCFVAAFAQCYFKKVGLCWTKKVTRGRSRSIYFFSSPWYSTYFITLIAIKAMTIKTQEYNGSFALNLKNPEDSLDRSYHRL